MKKVSVVILNWNGAHLLRSYLPSVCRHTNQELADIVVADNGSDDDSLEMLANEFPQVKVIAMPVNSGFAEGYNIALRSIETEYSVLLNSDVEVTDGWLEPLVGFAEANPDVMALQPKILSLRNRNMFEYAGACGGFIDSFGFPYCRGRIFGKVEADNGQYDNPIEIFWASGACFFTRTSEYVETGGLDRHFFAHMEEIDLCWRYHLRNHRIMCIPQSVVYHLGGATLDVNNPRKTYLNFRNNILMLYKNLPSKGKERLILKRLLIDAFAGVSFLLQGKVANLKAICNAHFDARDMIREYYSDYATADNEEVLSRMGSKCVKSIVWEYYVRGRKRFSQLGK